MIMDSPAGRRSGLRSEPAYTVFAWTPLPPIARTGLARAATPTGLHSVPATPPTSLRTWSAHCVPRTWPTRGGSYRSQPVHSAAVARNSRYEAELAKKDEVLNHVIAAFHTEFNRRTQLETELDRMRAIYEDRIRDMTYSNEQAIAHRVAVASSWHYEETLRADEKIQGALEDACEICKRLAAKEQDIFKEMNVAKDELNNARNHNEALRRKCARLESAGSAGVDTTQEIKALREQHKLALMRKDEECRCLGEACASEASRARKAELEITRMQVAYEAESQRLEEAARNKLEAKTHEIEKLSSSLMRKSEDCKRLEEEEAQEIQDLREQHRLALEKRNDELNNVKKDYEAELVRMRTQLESARISKHVEVTADNRTFIEVDENREQLLAVARSLAQRMESMAA